MESVIVFLGTMNAMPMMYAMELKKLGYNVLYFVEVSQKDTLSRPENHFPGISYPYPSWIIELVLPSGIFVPLFPRLFASLYSYIIKQKTGRQASCFVLNGLYSSMAPFLAASASKIGLPHGSDLDTWAYTESTDVVVNNFVNRSVFKYLPKFLSRILIKSIINKQYHGYATSDAVVYFPKGFNAQGDKVIDKLGNNGVRFVPRYDMSFEPLLGQPREFKKPSEKLELFSGVRFLFQSFPEGNVGYNKGNDVIIKGIAKYFLINPNIVVHFVEKGEDVMQAKTLCQQLGLEEAVVWHKEMPFKDLLLLYNRADICFDQVGEHWIAAIGAYALWLGKPLIANADIAVRCGIWPPDNPVCSARTAEEVYEWLVKLTDPDVRRTVSERSRDFADASLGPNDVLNKIFELH